MQQGLVIPSKPDRFRKGLNYRLGNRGADRACRASEVKRSAWYRNLKQLYERSDKDTRNKGLKWYIEAHEFAKALSQRYGLDVKTIAQVIAALSPAAKWERNLIDAEEMIKAYYHRGYIGAKNVTCCTYGKNKEKALEILTGRVELNPTKGLKTYNFYNNIKDPLDTYAVTIDRHAIRVLQGKKEAGSVTIKPHEYKRAASTYRLLAGELGLIPCQLQAITWLQYKGETQHN